MARSVARRTSYAKNAYGLQGTAKKWSPGCVNAALNSPNPMTNRHPLRDNLGDDPATFYATTSIHHQLFPFPLSIFAPSPSPTSHLPHLGIHGRENKQKGDKGRGGKKARMDRMWLNEGRMDG